MRQLGLGIVELLLVFALYVAYRLGRLITADRTETARAHARLVHHLEGVLQLPSEAAIQHAVHSVRLLEAANVYYLSAHFPVTIAFLVWGFVARPRSEYLWARRLLVVLTLLGLVAHILFPLAPPRMFPHWGFLDTMTTYGPSAYDGTSGALVNQYAAMPSLHIGWAVLIAVVVCRTGPRRPCGPGLPARPDHGRRGHRDRQPLAARRSGRGCAARRRAPGGSASGQPASSWYDSTAESGRQHEL